jgi:hypothetical protein
LATNLGICQLNEKLEPTSCKPVLPPKEIEDNSFEDARLFIHHNKLWASFTISQYPATTFASVVGYGRLTETKDAWHIGPYYIPNYESNDFTAIQKNWIFLSHGEQLWCIHGVRGNEQIVLQLEGARIEEVYKSKALPWRYADIHGGAICHGENTSCCTF